MYGGTLSSQDKFIIERYDSKDDTWEIMNIKLSDKFPFFNTFHTFSILLVGGKDSHNKRKVGSFRNQANDNLELT